MFGNVDNHSTIAREEIFGPVLSVIPADERGSTRSTSPTTRSTASTPRCSRTTSSAPTPSRASSARAPSGHNCFRTDFGIAFGGFKQSGIGREGGVEGLYPFLETKTVILDAKPAHVK